MNFHSSALTGVMESRFRARECASWKARGGAQLGEADQPGLADEPHVDVEPARRLALRLAVEVGAFLVELACIGIRRRRNLRDARDARLGTARVIEEDLVADLASL